MELLRNTERDGDNPAPCFREQKFDLLAHVFRHRQHTISPAQNPGNHKPVITEKTRRITLRIEQKPQTVNRHHQPHPRRQRDRCGVAWRKQRIAAPEHPGQQQLFPQLPKSGQTGDAPRLQAAEIAAETFEFPEQLRGVTLYAGHVPFDGETAINRNHCHSPLPKAGR